MWYIIHKSIFTVENPIEFPAGGILILLVSQCNWRLYAYRDVSAKHVAGNFRTERFSSLTLFRKSISSLFLLSVDGDVSRASIRIILCAQNNAHSFRDESGFGWIHFWTHAILTKSFNVKQLFIAGCMYYNFLRASTFFFTIWQNN